VAVSETQQSMNKIFELSESLHKTISKLGEGSKDIAKILAVITEITDKTKLLSLNASIIAAQSGEHGRGFAVVANEMKLLSDKTVESTTEISSILGAIHHNIADAVRETSEANTIVKEGSRVVTHAEIALKEVLSSSLHAQEKVAFIRKATDLQQEKLKLVVDSLEKLSDVNISVSQSTANEESNIRTVGKSIGELRDTTEQLRFATEQQYSSMKEMMSNIEASTERTRAISNEVHEAQQVNGAICASLSDVVDVGAQTVETLVNAAARIEVVSEEVGKLRAEMKQFNS
jgi:methyl-accepting chemotaxis protein